MSNIWSFSTLYKYGRIFSNTGQCVHKCKYLRIVQFSVQCASLPTTFWHFDLLRCASLYTSCISDIYHLKKTSHLTFSHKDPSRPFQQFWSDHWTSCFDLSRGWRKDNLWSPKVDAIHAKTRQSFVEGSFWRTGKLCKTQMDNCLNSRVSHLSNNKRLRS